MTQNGRGARPHRIVSVRYSGRQIAEIAVTDGHGMGDETTWTTADAVAAINAGTDAFFVASTVWSPVEVWNGEFLRTDPDRSAYTNLENLPTF